MLRRALPLLVLLTACTTTPEPESPITTDRSSYVLQNGQFGPETTITATFQAPADQSVHLINCNGAIGAGLQRKVGEQWVDAWVASMNACLSAPIVVPPKGRHTIPILVRPRSGAVLYPRRNQEELESGTYRVVLYGALTSFDVNARPFGPELPLEQRVSGPFTLERPGAVTTPPPPSPPTEPTVTVSGLVRDRRGHTVSHASVLVLPADANCRPTGTSIGAVTDERGEFTAIIPLEGIRCVVVEGRSGGASGTASATITSAPPRVDVRLAPGAPVTESEGERLVRLLATAINDPAADQGELPLYILHGPEALRVALEQYRTVLGRVANIERVPFDAVDARRFAFTLHGSSGKTSQVDVYQEDLTRLHSPLLDYGFRSAGFINAYLRTIAAGDAEGLSRVMNPDDVDFPVERAREMIADYRRRYGDPAAIRPAFAGVDERRHSITWLLRGTSPDGAPVSERIELGFGDGLIGVRGRNP